MGLRLGGKLSNLGDYIVRFYNDRRLSSTLSYVSPNAYERHFESEEV